MAATPDRDYNLPIVTDDTVNGLFGTISGKDYFFRDADNEFYNRQRPLYDVVMQWAELEGGPDAVKIARGVAAIIHFALSEQAATDSLEQQNPSA
ncbi:MAG TPA: hypothetical protein VLF69_01375 [Candidatus Saccharimonadales bacterium]|nr:hypothetical protein [Candidatus Saccharimonadales bacterium]